MCVCDGDDYQSLINRLKWQNCVSTSAQTCWHNITEKSNQVEKLIQEAEEVWDQKAKQFQLSSKNEATHTHTCRVLIDCDRFLFLFFLFPNGRSRFHVLFAKVVIVSVYLIRLNLKIWFDCLSNLIDSRSNDDQNRKSISILAVTLPWPPTKNPSTYLKSLFQC